MAKASITARGPRRHSGTGRRSRRARAASCAAALAAALLGAVLAPAAAAQTTTTSSADYTPCLGCAEHEAMQTRWRRPFLIEMEVAGLVMFTHFRLEAEARSMGLCESDVLIRSPLAAAGCHPYSARRAWLLEAPLEVVAFTSPAWGLERRGHPRWALLFEAVPIVYHAWSAHATIHAIHQWQRQQYLYFGPGAVPQTAPPVAAGH